MEKAKRIILGCICILSVLLAGGENADGSCDLVWSLSWLAAATVSGLGLKKMEEEK